MPELLTVLLLSTAPALPTACTPIAITAGPHHHTTAYRVDGAALALPPGCKLAAPALEHAMRTAHDQRQQQTIAGLMDEELRARQ